MTLERFIDAQDRGGEYVTDSAEIRKSRKWSH